MNPHLQRALLLFEQSRHELAEQELRQALAGEPGDAYAHSLLALCLSERKEFKPATEEAKQAIHLAPDFPFAHYALARVLYDREHLPEALSAIEEAIRLDPTAADYFSLLAGIHFQEKRWADTLQAAGQGLEFDAEHIGCTNLRAMALVKLGRKAEAGATIDAALAKNPDNSVTHANQGWTYLEKNDTQKALEHFRESLRLDPENEWARQGIVEALKARHFIYSLMLRYFLWMAKLSGRAQMAIIFGGYLGNNLLGSLARSKPDLAPWITPVRMLYIAFAVLTWIADPLFNLLLRLNKFGRLALSREQVVASNWLGLALLLALGSLAISFGSSASEPWTIMALVFGLLCMPVAGVFRCPEGWPRWVGLAVTLLLLGIGTVAVGLMFASVAGPDQYYKQEFKTAMGLLGVFSIGVLGASFLFNFLMAARSRR